MKAICMLLLLTLMLCPISLAEADKWRLFPDGITWASTAEEVCKLHNVRTGRMRCYETFQMLTMENANIACV